MQYELFLYPLERLRRLHRANPLIFGKRLRMEMLRLLREGL